MNLEHLLYWIGEREKIRALRASGAPKPWTDDPLMRDWRYCNVRREDDAVTIWIRENWREPHADDPDLWFAMVVARFVNWPDTLAEMGYPVPWSREKFLSVMAARKGRGETCFGPAYNISNGGSTAPKDQHLVNKVFAPLWAKHERLRPRTGDTLDKWHRRLTDCDGLGSFMAAQVVADMKYVEPLKSAADWMTFAASGPGSRRGLNRVLGRGPDTRWTEEEWRNALRGLDGELRPELERIGLGDLHAQDLQNLLCETDKFLRVKLGEGTPKRRYDGGAAVAAKASQPAIKPEPAVVSAALESAERGWPVFPCSPETKRPLTKHGFKDATTDAATITAWWQRWPKAMIGVPMGERSGVFAIDPDVPKAPGDPDGVAAWEALVAANGIPQTRHHKTPSGGRHVLFKWNADRPVTNSPGNLPKGVDVRGQGGYICVPPSVMANGGGAYELIGGEIADAPQWLYGLVLTKPNAVKSNGKGLTLEETFDGVEANGKSDHCDPEFEREMKSHAGEGVSTNPNDVFAPADAATIQAALAVIPSDTYQTWFEVGAAIRRELGDAGFKLFDEWSRELPAKYNAIECEKKWAELGKVTRFTAGTIFHYANQADPNWRDRVATPETKQSAPAPTAKPAQPPASETADPDSVFRVLRSAADLRTKKYEPLRWIVPNYLPEGLTLLAGKPKIGKSWLALDVAAAVITGGVCLGQQCEQGDVLGLFLEDTDRRLQRRMTTMFGAQLQSWPQIKYATAWRRLNAGGLEWMAEWIKKAEKPRLIIVDILQRVRPGDSGRQAQYNSDYEALAELQRLAGKAQLSVLVLHHQRKMGAEDLIDTVSGTLGLGGAVDAFIILGKDDTGKFLYGRGRDLDEFAVAVTQDERCRWHVLGPKPEAQASPERGRIVAALAKAGRPMNIKEITEAVGGKYPNIKNLLSKLHAEGDVDYVGTGTYTLPNPQAGLPLGDDVI